MVDVDTELLKRTRRWRTITLFMLVGATIRTWLAAVSPGSLFVAIVWTGLAIALGLVAASEVRQESRQVQQ